MASHTSLINSEEDVALERASPTAMKAFKPQVKVLMLGGDFFLSIGLIVTKYQIQEVAYQILRTYHVHFAWQYTSPYQTYLSNHQSYFDV